MSFSPENKRRAKRWSKFTGFSRNWQKIVILKIAWRQSLCKYNPSKLNQKVNINHINETTCEMPSKKRINRVRFYDATQSSNSPSTSATSSRAANSTTNSANATRAANQTSTPPNATRAANSR